MNKMKGETIQSSSGAYLGGLFLMIAEERYKPLKKFLHKAFLVEK
jgi:hypothetical protein